jgi:hypothetical protein
MTDKDIHDVMCPLPHDEGAVDKTFENEFEMTHSSAVRPDVEAEVLYVNAVTADEVSIYSGDGPHREMTTDEIMEDVHEQDAAYREHYGDK